MQRAGAPGALREDGVLAAQDHVHQPANAAPVGPGRVGATTEPRARPATALARPAAAAPPPRVPSAPPGRWPWATARGPTASTASRPPRSGLGRVPRRPAPARASRSAPSWACWPWLGARKATWLHHPNELLFTTPKWPQNAIRNEAFSLPALVTSALQTSSKQSARTEVSSPTFEGSESHKPLQKRLKAAVRARRASFASVYPFQRPHAVALRYGGSNAFTSKGIKRHEKTSKDIILDTILDHLKCI